MLRKQSGFSFSPSFAPRLCTLRLLFFSDDDARGRLRQLEIWSGRATILILLGIIGDIVLLFVFPREVVSTLERWSQVSAKALIGIGLIIEYVCIVRTISATSAEQTESDQRVANA